MSSLRKRILLVVFSLLIQLTVLLGLLVVLWITKVKDVGSGDVFMSSVQNSQVKNEAIINSLDIPIVQTGWIIHATSDYLSFDAVITHVKRSKNVVQFNCKILRITKQSSYSESKRNVTHVNFWLRERRALTLLLSKSYLQ